MPAEDKSTFLQIRITPELKDGLNDLRRTEPDLPSMSELVRRMVAERIEAHRKAKPHRVKSA